MSDIKISSRTYIKLILHAAKYPHCAINGILLAEKESAAPGKTLQIVDAIPLFHQCLHLAPMTEVALMQIDGLCDDKELEIAGYYAAPENLYHNTLDKVPAIKIADKIAENCSNSCLVLIDNRYVSPKSDTPALKTWKHVDGRWAKSGYKLEEQKTTMEAMSTLLKRQAWEDIVDFDNHLDDPSQDWTNEHLNRDLGQILAMY